MNPFAVAIVNYNTCEHLRACLASIQVEQPTEVVVVDNASSDGSAEMVRSEYPWVRLFDNEANLGYGAGANQAVAGCSQEYILLLNADTMLQPGTLSTLSTYLDDHPHAAVVGPRLLDVDGTLQPSCYPFPTPLDTLLANSPGATWVGRLIRCYVPILRNFDLRTWPHTFARVVPYVKGAALAIRREAFEVVGGFDTSFFMYFEDADLCYRLTAAGWQVHFTPETTVVHVGRASTSQHRAEMNVRLLTSTIQFYQRHASSLHLREVVLIVKGLILARWISGTARLYLTRHPGKRAGITADIAACRSVLFGHWRRLVT
jgi:N-acetylglucosaminyl-diphospho-decaprenol L-rhamnosyltransferase